METNQINRNGIRKEKKIMPSLTVKKKKQIINKPKEEKKHKRTQ